MNMRSVYRKIAKKHGVSVAAIKREMQAAIDYAYQTPNQSERARQKSVPYKGETPTPEEFIHYVAAEVREKQK